ncbi:MAG: metallophosphoesterase [Ancrocorticia sp.]
MLRQTINTGLALGAGAALWGLTEAQAYTLRRRSILIDGGTRAHTADAPDGSDRTSSDDVFTQAPKPLRALHLSDIHLVPWQRRRIKWIQSLAQTQPDFLILTGDQLASKRAVEPLLEALAPFEGIPGAFVYGSNDYFGPIPKNPFIYLFRDNSKPHSRHSSSSHSNRVELPWQKMTAEFEARGWINLNNARASVRTGGWNLDLVGVDDPHISRDEFPAVVGSGCDDGAGSGAGDGLASGSSSAAGSGSGVKDDDGAAQQYAAHQSGAAGGQAHLKLGLVHAPYRKPLDQMVADGCDAVFAGHTHGGQVCLPGVGALVTNCDLDREYASGLFQWPPTGKEIIHGDATVPTGMESFPTAWVNVSTGLGHSPFTPFRVACRPEAVLVEFTLV